MGLFDLALHRAGPVLAVASGLALAISCAMPEESSVIDGLPCLAGTCAPGYVCEKSTNRCLLPGEIADSGAAGSSSGGSSGGGASNGGFGGAVLTGGAPSAGGAPGAGGLGGAAGGSTGGAVSVDAGSGGAFVVLDAASDASDGGPAHDAAIDARALCDDGVLDGEETDRDCGGPDCGPCALGQSCEASRDCESAACGATDGGVEVCISPCADGIIDGNETDTDCGGGSCPPCPTNDACLSDIDCTSRNCSSDICKTPTCTDGKEDGVETDVDCGVYPCRLCAVGKTCLTSANCTSLYCDPALHCATPTCADGAKNGAETDVDCGGGVCPKCPTGAACIRNADCQSGSCASKVCGS